MATGAFKVEAYVYTMFREVAEAAEQDESEREIKAIVWLGLDQQT